MNTTLDKLCIEIQDDEWPCIQWRGPCTMGHFYGNESRILLRPPCATTFVNDRYLTDHCTLNDFRQQLANDNYPLATPCEYGAFLHRTPGEVRILVSEAVTPRPQWQPCCENFRATCPTCLEIERTKFRKGDLTLTMLDHSRANWYIHDATALQDELAFIDQELTRRGVKWFRLDPRILGFRVVTPINM
jgi:hypothetical protein